MAKKLYVGNLPFSVTQEELEGLFGQYGAVQSVNIIMDRMTGKPRGFAFVEMEDADKAMQELNGKELQGRPLTVNEAREKPKGEGGGSRGGFKGGNRDRW